MSPRRATYRSILDDPAEEHRMTGEFRGATHYELVGEALKAAKDFFGDDDAFWFFVEGFNAKRLGTGLQYRAELTVKRVRKGSEEWAQRLREVISEHESDETTSSCHAHEEDRPCCIDYIAGLDSAEYEDRPTRPE